MYRLCWIFI